MPAKIIQTNTTPFTRVTVDPITLDIVENALRNARAEMDAVLFRTAMSPGIREQHDAFPMIANEQGKMVVGQFGSFLYGFMQGYEGTIEDGDIFLTNDPYSCGGAVSHLNDWLLMMPIFHEGRLVSWSAMFGHMTDVGGKVPGSLPTDAKMIYEEGLIIPPTKIYRKGELNAELFNILLANTRMPEWNKSDFLAIIASLRLAERRVRENIQRFGWIAISPRCRTCSTATSSRWAPSSRCSSPKAATRPAISRTGSTTTGRATARSRSPAPCGARAIWRSSTLPGPTRSRSPRSISC